MYSSFPSFSSSERECCSLLHDTSSSSLKMLKRLSSRGWQDWQRWCQPVYGSLLEELLISRTGYWEGQHGCSAPLWRFYFCPPLLSSRDWSLRRCRTCRRNRYWNHWPSYIVLTVSNRNTNFTRREHVGVLHVGWICQPISGLVEVVA